MKDFLGKFVLTLAILFVASTVIPRNSFAAENFLRGNTVHLAADKSINTDYYAAGGTNILDGTVNGDAYLAGGNVVINGNVFGDVLVAGGNISINGRVTGNVRAVGGQIVLTGEIDKNVSVAGGSVAIQKPAIIHGSFTSASGNLSVLAPIGKGAVIAGGQASINSAIGGDVRATIEQLEVMQDADINGKLYYWSPNQAHIVPFTIKDSTTYFKTEFNAEKYQGPSPRQIGRAAFGISVMWFAINLAMSFAIGLLFLHLVPVFMENLRSTISEQTVKSLIIGLIAVVLLPFTFVVLLITVVGIPFALLLGVMFILLALMNQIFIAYAIGKKLLPKRNELALLTGLVIVEVVCMIPVIGWMFSSIALFIGIGALVMVKRNLYFSFRSKKLI